LPLLYIVTVNPPKARSMSTESTIILGEDSNVFKDQPVTNSIYDWILNEVQSYILGPVLEMNSGLGTVSAELVTRGIRVRLSDKDKANRDRLRQRFKGIEAMRAVCRFDFSHPDFESLFTSAFGTFGSVIALNIMEYGYYDPVALRNAIRLLRPGGHLILIFPASTTMFYGPNSDPEALKQYHHQALKDILRTDFDIIKIRSLNLNLTPQQANPCIKNLGLSVLAVTRKLW
jgi:SAM-dependent methyltransferase